ncbi:MAG: HDc protein, partial [Acidobacteriota bacterium]|nr:HDc protein [Acidobacteriota bacterium]
MIEFQKVLNLPSWWPGDVGRIEQKLAEEIKKCNFPPDEEKLILSAWEIAKKYHSPQTRADGVEYVIHVYRVTLSLILEFGESSSEFILAALLHDILEDTGYTCEEMTKAFGDAVTRLVESITRREGENRPAKGDRIQDKYFEKIIKSGVNSIKLKLADKLDNIRDALNHPKFEKRRMYVRECQTVFLPLIKKLGSPVLERKIHQLFEEAMLNHPCFIDQVLLFNPVLDYWLTGDNIKRVKITLNHEFTAVDLVKSVSAAIINKIDAEKIGALLYIADLPAFLNNPAKKYYWDRVKGQLNALKELLSLDTPPAWLKPILETPEYLLPVIHSRLFMPASWLFPLWQKDYVQQILESNKETYLSLFERQITEKWVTRLRLLLICREAFWRYITGNGEYSASLVLAEIKKAEPSLGLVEYRLLVSMRLLAEYLEAKDDLGIHPNQLEEKFSKLWIQLSELYGPGSIPKTNKVEVIDFDKVRQLCPGLENPLDDLRGILMEYIAKNIGTHPIVWINFNTREIEKRLKFFREALHKVHAKTLFSDLKGIGIYVQQDLLDDIFVFTIEPDNWDAVKDRIPEISDAERTEIQNKNYSAAAIFDVLLMRKLEQGVKEPIWAPRVYRILDTMSDFDPLNVQPLTVSFQAEEKIKNNIVYLPIPPLEESAEQIQAKRKEIVARYIVTMIYNYVVTLGIYSAAVDCSPLDENKVKLGFTNNELEHMLCRWAETLGYEKNYGRFLEDFNFKKFSVKAALCPRESTGFAVKDITGYGSFLGIDIGGTYIKVSLFRKGEIAFGKNQLLTFKTFEQSDGGHVPVDAFCNRIISEVEAGFKKRGPKSNFNWEKLDGVGISWPGAVSGSKIIATSGVLRRLSFQEGGKTVSLHQDSSPHDI